MVTKECTKCGAENDAVGGFCLQCGSVITTPAQDRNAALERVNNGTRLMRIKSYEEAVTVLTEAISLYPRLTGAYRSRAEAYRMLGRQNEADDDDRMAAQIVSDSRRISTAQRTSQTVVKSRNPLEFSVATVIGSIIFALLLGLFITYLSRTSVALLFVYPLAGIIAGSFSRRGSEWLNGLTVGGLAGLLTTVIIAAAFPPSIEDLVIPIFVALNVVYGSVLGILGGLLVRLKRVFAPY